MRKESQLQTKRFNILSIFVFLVICCNGLYGCPLAASTAVTAAVGEVSLSKNRANIQVIEDEKLIKDCKFIKEVRAKSHWGGLLFQEKALEKTISEMTHESAEAGANFLWIKSKSKSFVGSNFRRSCVPVSDRGENCYICE